MFKNLKDIREAAKQYEDLSGYVKQYLTNSNKWNGYTELDYIDFAVDQDYIEAHVSGFFMGAWDTSVIGVKYNDIINLINNNNKSFNEFNYGQNQS